ncbi:MAG: hypothetical protein K2J32_10385, partial [Ruminococcus sp.]|nr:hypothetical protein [Ruminococcus sp.]
CYMMSIETFSFVILGILFFSLLVLIIVSNKITKITTDKNNLNSFLQIANDEYIKMGKNGFLGKRKLNKQMTFALNLKLMLNQFDNTKNENRKKLYDFINNNYYLKDENEFVRLCENCLNNKENPQDEMNVVKLDITKLTRRFVLSNVKIVIFYAMIIVLLFTIIIDFGEIIVYFPKVSEFLTKRKDSIETANTIVFDIAAILLLYFEIKQEDI